MNRGLYVVMGVAGAGKTEIGAALARALGVHFLDGDDYHPPENREKMAAGIPLTDDDREPWLRLLASRLADAKDAGTGLIVACSALKRSYRDLLRAGAGDVRFIYLKGDAALLAERLARRRGHFMPAGLLESQLETLEEPTPDEEAWVCDIRTAPQDIVASLVARVAALVPGAE